MADHARTAITSCVATAGKANPGLDYLRRHHRPVASPVRALFTSRSSAGAWQLEGSVAPRAAPSADLAAQLALLGPADANGRRLFAIAGRP